MQRDSALATVAVLMTMALATPDAGAQSLGQTYYLNGLPGVPNSDCARGGCHANNPLSEPNRVMKAACTTIPIYGSPDAGMQAVVSLYTDAQLSAIASYLCTLVAPPPPPPPPPPGGPPPPPPPPPPGTQPPPRKPLVEFFHEGFGHYFITNFDAEINGIDAGVIQGWQRTGRSFGAYASNNGFQTPVCRFFTGQTFAPKSSHFYTADAVECFGVKSNPKWQYEQEAFWVEPVDAFGGCPAGFTPVYRLYNNGQTGAPNHRYTVDLALYADFATKNWAPEGIQFCAPN